MIPPNSLVWARSCRGTGDLSTLSNSTSPGRQYPCKGAASKERWKAEIRRAANRRVEETIGFTHLDHRPVAVTIYYFPAAPMDGDVDNIVKPIMDALEWVAYLHDHAVERAVVQKFEPHVSWQIANPSQQLAAALDSQTPIVYIRVDDDLSWRRVP